MGVFNQIVSGQGQILKVLSSNRSLTEVMICFLFIYFNCVCAGMIVNVVIVLATFLAISVLSELLYSCSIFHSNEVFKALIVVRLELM